MKIFKKNRINATKKHLLEHYKAKRVKFFFIHLLPLDVYQAGSGLIFNLYVISETCTSHNNFSNLQSSTSQSSSHIYSLFVRKLFAIG